MECSLLMDFSGLVFRFGSFQLLKTKGNWYLLGLLFVSYNEEPKITSQKYPSNYVKSTTRKTVQFKFAQNIYDYKSETLDCIYTLFFFNLKHIIG